MFGILCLTYAEHCNFTKIFYTITSTTQFPESINCTCQKIVEWGYSAITAISKSETVSKLWWFSNSVQSMLKQTGLCKITEKDNSCSELDI